MFDEYDSNPGNMDDTLDQVTSAEDAGKTADSSPESDEKNQLNYQPNSAKSDKVKPKSKKQKVRGLMKKLGPVGAIVAILITSFLGLSSAMTPGLAINHFAAAVDGKLNLQDSFLKNRSNKLVSERLTHKWKKISGVSEAKKGFLSNRRDRFSKISESFGKRLGESGFEVTFGESRSFTGKKQIAEIKYTNPRSGKVEIFDNAKDFNVRYATDLELRQDFNHATKNKFGRMWDDAATDIKRKLGFETPPLSRKTIKPDDADTDAEPSKTKKTSDLDEIDDLAEKNKKIADRFDDNVAGGNQPGEVKNRTISYDAANEKGEIKTKHADLIGDDIDIERTNATSKELRKSHTAATAGDSPVMSKIAGFTKIFDLGSTVCGAYTAVRASGALAKIPNMLQVARFALTFMSLAHAISAGDASEEEIAFVGGKLLMMVPSVIDGGKAIKQLVGGIRGAYQAYQGIKSIRTAMDSTGFIYASQSKLRDKITPKTDPSATKFQNATNGTVEKYIKDIGGVTHLDEICGFLNTPLFNAVESAAGIASFVVSTVGKGVQTIIKEIAPGVIKEFAKGLGLSLVTNELQNFVAREVQASLTGLKASSQTAGEDMGNAITSGLGGYQSRLGANRGGGLLNHNAAASAMAERRIMLAQEAADDRATRSPFDASSPNTFLGSIIYKSWPYYSQAQTFFGKIKALFGLARNFADELLPSSHALAYAADLASFTQCQDYDYIRISKKSDDGENYPAAFDPFCNPIQGVPIAALYDQEEAELAGLDAPGVLVADGGTGTSSAEFEGQWFTPDKVNDFFEQQSDDFFTDLEKGKTINSVLKNNSGLKEYYDNCVDRISKDGDPIPYGDTFTQGKNDGSFKNLLFGSGKSKGNECILTNEDLYIPGDYGEGNEYQGYTENGKRVMYALFFIDEHAQCLLDNSEDCQLELSGSGANRKKRQRSLGGAWPIAGVSLKKGKDSISQGFHDGHTAIDITDAHGTDLVAVEAGEVTVIEDGCPNTGSYPCDFANADQPCVVNGNHVEIRTANNRFYYYGHLSSVSVEVGDKVEPGDILGVMGTSGCSTGTHLHFQINEGGSLLQGQGIPVDPISVLESLNVGYSPPATSRPAGLGGADDLYSSETVDIIDRVSAEYDVPGALLQATLLRESSGDWDRDGSRVVHLPKRGPNVYILPYAGIVNTTAAAYGFDFDAMKGDKEMQIAAAAAVLSNHYEKHGDWEKVICVYYSGDPSCDHTPSDSFQYGTTREYLAQMLQYWEALEGSN